MNLASIVALLQLVLAMLSNSNAAQNAQTQALASQAMGYATQALQTAITSTSTSPSLSSVSQTTIQPTAMGTPYCVSYSGGNCVLWKNSSIPIPPLTISTPATSLANPSTAATSISSGGNSAQDIEELQNQYAQELGIIHNSPGGLSVQQGEESDLNELYNVELQAAQLDAPCFSANLTLAGGEQGLAALQNASNCVASVQKEANNTQTPNPSPATSSVSVAPSTSNNDNTFSEWLTQQGIYPLASYPDCQNSPNAYIQNMCLVTSTAMCGFQLPSSQGGHELSMLCSAVELCSAEHDCP